MDVNYLFENKIIYDIDSGVEFFFTIKFYFWHFECRGLTFIELN